VSRERSSEGARAEPGPDVAAVRRVVVPPRVAEQAGGGDPTAPAQDLVRPEPGLRVDGVNVRREPGVREEVVGRPLPDVDDHLPAPERAVAGGERADVETAHGPRVEVRPRRRRGLVAPREAALAVGEAVAIRTRLEGRGGLPLRLRREPPTGP